MSIARCLVLAVWIGCGGGGPPPQAAPDDDPPRDPVSDPAGRGWHCASSNARCYRDAAECRTWDEGCARQEVAYCVEQAEGVVCYLEAADCEANRPDAATCSRSP